MTKILMHSASTLHPDPSVRPSTFGVTRVEGDDSFSTHRVYLDDMSTSSGNYFDGVCGAVHDYLARCEESGLVPIPFSEATCMYQERTVKQEDCGRVVETVEQSIDKCLTNRHMFHRVVL